MAVSKTAELKFGMLSGALKNAGDFLIVKRSEQLVRHIYPNAELFFYNRCKSLETYLYEINRLDALIFCGGPMYIPQLYPEGLPLVSDLRRIQVPMFALGLGWFGSSGTGRDICQYYFDEPTKMLFQRIEGDTKQLGCRDWHSVNVLRNNGIYSGKMTGCPAWYYLELTGRQDVLGTSPGRIKKVCISDPADSALLGQMVDLTAYARQLFPSAELTAVFHRGMQADAYTDKQTAQLIQQTAAVCRELGAQCMDISYSEDGFAVYDDCDIHIGFRVHAHIYNLSRRNLSILIEEDGRGSGVNRALGLESITAYDYRLQSREKPDCVITSIAKTENTCLLRMVDDYINNLYQTGFLQMKNAYRLMQDYYQQMEQHISSLCEYI